MSDLISIIIPVFNSQLYIENTVESIEKQTYKKIEIVLVNDGSTDESLNIMKRLKKKYKNILLIDQINKGVSAARNNGLKSCNGNYIVFVDSDDILPSNSIEILYNQIRKEKSDIVCGLTKVIKYTDYRDLCQMKNCDEQVNSYNRKEILKKFLLCNDEFDYHSSCSKIYTKEVINNVEFTEGRNSNEDRFFVFESLCNANKVTCIKSDVYLYVKHNNSLSNSKPDKRLFDNIFFADEILININKHHNDLSIEAEYNQLITYLMVYRNFSRNRESFRAYRNELLSLRKKILQMQMSQYVSKSKKIEILILKKLSCFYSIFLKIYDFFKK